MKWEFIYDLVNPVQFNNCSWIRPGAQNTYVRAMFRVEDVKDAKTKRLTLYIYILLDLHGKEGDDF